MRKPLPLLLPFLALFALKPPAARVDELSRTPEAGALIEEFEVTGDGDVLLLPCKLDGKTYLFLLDTGSGCTMLDASFKPALGKPVDQLTMETPNGAIQTEMYRLPKATVGTIPFETSSPVAVLDLSRLRAATGHAIYGVLGMDFLRRHVIRIDFDAGRVSFLRSVGPDPGNAVEISNNAYGVPSVEGQVPVWGAEPFVIDTGYMGFGSGALQNLAFRSAETSGRLRVTGEHRSSSASGDTSQRHGRVETLEVGKASHREALVDEASYSIVGLTYLSRYTVTLDFPENKVYLKRGKQFAALDREDLSGLYFLRPHGATVVDLIEKGSPAELAGVATGDEILSVGDVQTDRLRLWELRTRLAEKDKKIRLRIKRGDQERDVTFVLAPWRPPK